MARYTVSKVLGDAFNFVAGKRIKPVQSSHHFTNFEPAVGKALCYCGISSVADVDQAVQSAKSAFPTWAQLSGFERGKILRQAATIIRENVNDIAYWEVRDNGKPIYEAKMDIEGCADTFEYCGGAAATVVGDHICLSGDRFAYTRREPFGVCGGIGAWNYPFQTASWKIAPSLACGNTFVYKPSPLSPVTAVMLAEILTNAGLPPGGINIVQAPFTTQTEFDVWRMVWQTRPTVIVLLTTGDFWPNTHKTKTYAEGRLLVRTDQMQISDQYDSYDITVRSAQLPALHLQLLHYSEWSNDENIPKSLCHFQGEAATGEALCLHGDVAKISFTGSVPTGQKIMQLCATRGLKPVTLELGGKSPLIIFDDAQMDNAVVGALMANFFTQGEVCNNASRVFVHESLHDVFVEKLLAKTKALKIGDPLKEDTKVGASISEDHVQRVIGYIETAKQEGAKVLYGGERVQVGESGFQDGYFLSPCIITNVSDQMKVAKEEIFGAVLLVLPFKDEEEVIKRANDTEFGLAAGLFTSNLQRAHRVAAQLQAGVIYINTFNDVGVEVPFGGYKMSGIGRENGIVSLDHYSQIKSVFVNHGDKLESPFE